MDLKSLTLDHLLKNLPEELLEQLGERVPQKRKDYAIVHIEEREGYCIRWTEYKGVRNDLELAERILNDSRLGKPNKSGLFHVLFDIFYEDVYRWGKITDPLLEKVAEARKDSKTIDKNGYRGYTWFRTYEITPEVMKKIYAEDPKKVLRDIMKIPLYPEENGVLRIKTVDELDFEQKYTELSVVDPGNTTMTLAEGYYDVDSGNTPESSEEEIFE